MKLGVVGTFVWDTIWTLADVQAGRPFETWGGVACSLAGAAAARPEGWEIVPIVKVGSDLADEAHRFMAALPGVSAGDGVLVVPEPNNRVELRYLDAARRDELQTGAVGGWTWEELAPRVAGLDALYVNYLSGFELDLAATESLRAHFGGPLYADLHSLFLSPPGDGARVPRRLPHWERWAACFDAVQLNDDELGMLGSGAEALVEVGAGAVVVTHGARGASLVRRPGLPGEPLEWPRWRGLPAGAAQAREFAARPCAGDPTGCGDVWGATFFTTLLGGGGWDASVDAAHAAARRKMGVRGASRLFEHLAPPP